MIIPLLIVFTIFPLLIGIIGFFLRLSGTIEDETVFYFLSGIMLTIVSIVSFASGIQYETGANSTVIGNNTITNYTYTNADTTSTTITSLCLLTTGLFLIISAYSIKNKRKQEKIDEEGESSW